MTDAPRIAAAAKAGAEAARAEQPSPHFIGVHEHAKKLGYFDDDAEWLAFFDAFKEVHDRRFPNGVLPFVWGK